jgi:hypothetical protein
MSEPPASQSELWRWRLQRLRTHARSGMLFAAGVLAVLLALLLYNLLVPDRPQLTTQEVNDSLPRHLRLPHLHQPLLHACTGR